MRGVFGADAQLVSGNVRQVIEEHTAGRGGKAAVVYDGKI